MTRKRKRVTPEGPYDRFWDLAHAKDYQVFVVRTVADGQVMLQVIAVKAGRERIAPMVTDVSELGGSIAALHEQIEREAA